MCEKPGEHPPKKERRFTQRAKACLAVALCAVAALAVLTVCVGYGYYRSKLALMQYSDGATTGDVAEDDGQTSQDNEDMQKAVEGLETRDAVVAEGEVTSESNVLNVLLIGTDERSREFRDNARGDTCMLLSVDKSTAKIHLVSFERGIGVPVLSGQYEGQWDWLTHMFCYGGADLMMREIEENFKVQVDYYARANIYTFMQMVDAVGGVDVTLTQAEADYINHPAGTYAESHIREMGIAKTVQKVTAGPNHLNGATAMLYARCRQIDNDWHRVQRQRNVLDSMMEAAKGLDLGELDAMLDTVLPYVQTNLPESEITAALLAIAPKLGSITLEQATLPAKGTYGSMTGMGGRSLYSVDFQANAELLHEMLYGQSEAQ